MTSDPCADYTNGCDISQHHLVWTRCSDTRMADDALIRKQNLKRLGKRPRELMTLLGRSYSYWRDLMEDPNKPFGEKAARAIEDKYPLPRGWLDRVHGDDEPIPHPGEIQKSPTGAVTLYEITVPDPITWEDLSEMGEVPKQFLVAMPDDALRGRVERGTGLIFSREVPPSPGKIVLVQDRDGNRMVRQYAIVSGDHWVAKAHGEGYVDLDSKAHGLRVLATVKWRED